LLTVVVPGIASHATEPLDPTSTVPSNPGLKTFEYASARL